MYIYKEMIYFNDLNDSKGPQFIIIFLILFLYFSFKNFALFRRFDNTFIILQQQERENKIYT